MMRYVFDKVLCPYIFCADKSQIKCEGALSGTKAVTEFGKEGDKEQFFNNVCCADYQLCPVYKMVTREKYEKNR